MTTPIGAHPPTQSDFRGRFGAETPILLEDARRGDALRLVGEDRGLAARIASAPPGYLMALDVSDLVRHAALVTPVPSAGEVRVLVTPGRSVTEWHVDLAARDRPGLLAASTGVLADLGIDVVQAVLATWDDGAALQAFVVRTPSAPDADTLERAFADALDRPPSSPPLADAAVTFDNETSTAFTACEVRAPDRPGLLHALAVGFAAAGADVHAAVVSTVDGVALDRFDLTDGGGHKLDDRLEAAIASYVRDGVSRPRPARRGWRRRTRR